MRAISLGLLLFGLYMGLAGSLSLSEAAVGVPAAAAGAVLALATRRAAHRRYRLSGGLRYLAEAFARIPKETAEVGRVLLFGPGDAVAGGRFESHPIIIRPSADVPPSRAASAAGARALTVLAQSMAPASYAIDLCDETLLLHRLPAPHGRERS